jgi:hypothetical protein
MDYCVSFEHIPNGLHAHNASASGRDADTTRSSDGTPSGVKDNQALGVVIQNYSICQQNAEQLRSLQEWISRTQTSTQELQIANEKKRK